MDIRAPIRRYFDTGFSVGLSNFQYWPGCRADIFALQYNFWGRFGGGLVEDLLPAFGRCFGGFIELYFFYLLLRHRQIFGQTT